jgi:hypothetical protein
VPTLALSLVFGSWGHVNDIESRKARVCEGSLPIQSRIITYVFSRSVRPPQTPVCCQTVVLTELPDHQSPMTTCPYANCEHQLQTDAATPTGRDVTGDDRPAAYCEVHGWLATDTDRPTPLVLSTSDEGTGRRSALRYGHEMFLTNVSDDADTAVVVCKACGRHGPYSMAEARQKIALHQSGMPL